MTINNVVDWYLLVVIDLIPALAVYVTALSIFSMLRVKNA
jgi:hypothetical protein